MNRNTKTQNLTEAAMITGILVIIAFISSFISIVMFFYPTPAIILAKRRGIKYSALALLAADLIITILLGVTTGFIYLILYTPFSLALAYGVYRDEKANKTLLYGAAAYMVSFVLLILATDAIMGVNFVEQLKTAYQEGYAMTENMISNMPAGLNPEQMDEALKQVETFREASDFILSNLFPAMVVMISLIASYLNYLVAEKFARRFSININKHVRLSQFTFPRTFMIAMAALLLISYLFALMKFNVGVIQLNLFNLVFLAMVLQGFAVIKFFLEKSQMTKAVKTLAMFMIVYMMLIYGGMILMIALAGLVDLSIDLRKLNKAA